MPNGAQRQVMEADGGPVWVLAGSGAGKTQALLLRCLRLLCVDQIPSESIVLTTFTHKAALQLRERLNQLLRQLASIVPEVGTITSVPGVLGRGFADELVGPTRPFTVRFADLDADEIAKLAGVAERATNIRAAVARACERLQRQGIDYRPEDLIAELTAPTGGAASEDPAAHSSPPDEDTERGHEDRRAALKATRYLEGLRDFAIWGYQDMAIADLLEPQQLTVFDLAGAEKVVAAYAAERVLRGIWQLALSGRLHHPIFIVLEEAHNLVPATGRAQASRIINTIAAEGRKFRVFLAMITQRPSKISQDALSQCGSQIIMRLTNPDDQRAVQQASEAISAELLANLPGRESAATHLKSGASLAPSAFSGQTILPAISLHPCPGIGNHRGQIRLGRRPA